MTEFPEVDSASQVVTLLVFFAIGVVMCLVYDVIRGWRVAKRHSNAVLFFEDVFYFFILSVVTFCGLLVRCNGEIRFFSLFSGAVGWFVCRMTLSRLFMKIQIFWIKLIKRWFSFVLTRILTPFVRKMRSFFVRTKQAVIKFAKKFTKYSKINKKDLKKDKRVLYNREDKKQRKERRSLKGKKR